MPAPASWLPAPLLQLLWPGQGAQLAADALRDTDHTSVRTNNSSSRASRRHEKRAARQQRRAHKRHEKQLKRAQQQDNSGGPFRTSHNSSSKSRAESVTGCASGFHAHVLAHMINTANTFPMLLQSAQHLQEQQQGQHNSSSYFAKSSSPHTSSSDHGASSLQDQVPSSSSSQVQGSTSSSSEKPRPQQLITVGCRHWGNAFVSGLLRVKIYDFAIYCDSHEVSWVVLVVKCWVPWQSLVQDWHRSGCRKQMSCSRYGRDICLKCFHCLHHGILLQPHPVHHMIKATLLPCPAVLQPPTGQGPHAPDTSEASGAQQYPGTCAATAAAGSRYRSGPACTAQVQQHTSGDVPSAQGCKGGAPAPAG